EKPQYAENLDKQNIRLMLRSTGEISDRTALKGIVDDPIEEFQTSMEEGVQKQKITTEMQDQMNREQMAGPQGDAAGQAGSSPAETGGMAPGDVEMQAVEIANRWLGMPDGDRAKDMHQVQAANPNLHALAKQKMEEIR